MCICMKLYCPHTGGLNYKLTREGEIAAAELHTLIDDQEKENSSVIDGEDFKIEITEKTRSAISLIIS
ncbi:hypothetical protein MNBD_GAMMA12-2914 [hydrothermal vent metagenome]|uniref:Uncharacterized protein n=1 Tax=hydrothermal vent metagenome TaxID=652676 RepID=A0A3B0ZN41_9ZZZZ